MIVVASLLGSGLLSLATHGTRLGFFNENGFNPQGALFNIFGAMLIGIIGGILSNKINVGKNK